MRLYDNIFMKTFLSFKMFRRNYRELFMDLFGNHGLRAALFRAGYGNGNNIADEHGGNILRMCLMNSAEAEPPQSLESATIFF